MTNVIELNMVREAKSKATNKQELINNLGEELKQLFLNDHGYFPYDIEQRPETIELRGIELNLLGNGHEDCPRYNYDLVYGAELEDENIQIWVWYYRASVVQRILVNAIYEDEIDFKPYAYDVPGDWIASTMMELMKDELAVDFSINK